MLVLSRLEGGLKRVNNASVAVDGLIYSFGGYIGLEKFNVERSIDVYILNMVSLRWKELVYSDSGNSANVPFRRYGHSAVAHDNIIYLWGGRREEVACNKIFLFDTNTRKWSAPKVKGTIPGARDGHAACISEGFMYIFGGFEEEKQEFSDTVFRFELKTCTWQALYQLTSDILKRDFLTSVVINDKIYLFGGRSYNGPFYDNKILELDLQAMNWCLPVIEGYKPVGRRSHSAVVVNNKMVIFGGYNDVTDEHFNDFNVFDPKTYSWSPVNTIGQDPPCARRRHCCIAVNSFLYIFGGSCPLPQATDSEAHHLMELSDLYIIDTSRSLRSMALQTVLNYNLDTSTLTTALAREVESYRSANDLICTQFNKLDLKSHEDDHLST